MAVSEKRIIFGVHSVTPYSRSTGKPMGIIKCLKSSTLQLSGETVDLNAGSLKYPWATEESKVNAEMSLKINEYPSFVFELFLGKAPTDTGVDAAGAISTPADVYGGTILDASNGISSIAVLAASKANLKFGKYVLVATDTDKVDILGMSDVDFARGTDAAFQDDNNKITASPITITAGNNDYAALGLRFVGTGTPAFTVGDTAEFEVKPPSTRSMEVVIGGASDTFPEFGAVIVSQARGNNELTFIDAYKCKGAGLPLGFEAGAFSESEVKVKLLYDPVKNGVFKFKSSLSSSSP